MAEASWSFLLYVHYIILLLTPAAFKNIFKNIPFFSGPPSRIPNLHSNYVQISLKSDQSLLVKPGTLDIFSVPVIPHITSYTIPPEPVDGGVRLAVKLPDGTRLCRRWMSNIIDQSIITVALPFMGVCTPFYMRIPKHRRGWKEFVQVENRKR